MADTIEDVKEHLAQLDDRAWNLGVRCAPEDADAMLSQADLASARLIGMAGEQLTQGTITVEQTTELLDYALSRLGAVRSAVLIRHLANSEYETAAPTETFEAIARTPRGRNGIDPWDSAVPAGTYGEYDTHTTDLVRAIAIRGSRSAFAILMRMHERRQRASARQGSDNVRALMDADLRTRQLAATLLSGWSGSAAELLNACHDLLTEQGAASSPTQ